jgi:hypothetical protein
VVTKIPGCAPPCHIVSSFRTEEERCEGRLPLPAPAVGPEGGCRGYAVNLLQIPPSQERLRDTVRTKPRHAATRMGG